jgi:exodeoxyribonuclease-3
MKGKMIAATFNANSIRVRLAIVLDWLRKNSPDVLCLQETKVPDAEFPALAFRELGYHAAFRGEKGLNGVAILSKTPVEDVLIGFDKSGAEGTRIVRATVGGIPVVNTYVPQGFNPMSEEFREKLDWLQRLLDYFKEGFSPRKPLLWCGDFNIAPEPIDVYDPEFLLGHVGYHPDEHAALRRFSEWGFVDVFRLHNKGPGQYSFYDYQIKNAVKKKQGWRIDHIWATRPLAAKSSTAWIDVSPRLVEKPSDHTFVVAEFET